MDGSTGQRRRSCSWSADQGILVFFPCPGSRWGIWSRERVMSYFRRDDEALLAAALTGLTWSSIGCVCVCVFFPFILDIKFVGRTSRGHTGGRSHGISHPPSFCGACLNFSREKDSAIPFPRRPWSRILCTKDLIVLHPLGIFFFFLVF